MSRPRFPPEVTVSTSITKRRFFFVRETFRNLGLYAQGRLTFTFLRYHDFSRCAMLLNTQISGILATTKKLHYDFFVHIIPRAVCLTGVNFCLAARIPIPTHSITLHRD